MIKEIQENEFAPFFELMAEIECGKHFDLENPGHVEWLKKKISIYFYRGVKFFGFYQDNGEPAGFASLIIEDGPEGISCLNQKCELLDIAVFKQYRGKGYGSELLRHVELYAKNKRLYCMFISAYAANYQAIAFYGKNGFIPAAVLPDVHGPNDEGIIFMRKIL